MKSGEVSREQDGSLIGRRRYTYLETGHTDDSRHVWRAIRGDDRRDSEFSSQRRLGGR